MEKKNAEYIVRDFSAIDQQIEEMSKRETALTWRLNIDNIKRLGIPLILFSCALAILLLALGVFIWLVQKERVIEIEKIVEVIREVPIISEKIKVVEVPVYIEVPRIQVEVPPVVVPPVVVPPVQIETDPVFSTAPGIIKNTTADNEELSRDVEEILRNGSAAVGGQLNFALRWGNTNDLDLHVETPSGETINYIKKVIGKGKLDSDKNTRQGLTATAIENIRWDKDAPEGTYKVYVSLFKDRSGSELDSTDYQLVVHKNGQAVASFAGSLSHSERNRRQLVTTMNFSD